MDLSDISQDASGIRAALELRVLSGRQKGARALLASDGAWTSLGRGEDNDLVLREAPFDQVHIGLQEGQWLWREGDNETLPLRSGQGIRLGDFTLVLCSPSLPWSSEDPQEWAVLRTSAQQGGAQGDENQAPAVGTDPADGGGAGADEALSSDGQSKAPDPASDPEESPEPAEAEAAAFQLTADQARADGLDEPSPAVRSRLLDSTVVQLAAGGAIASIAAAAWLFAPLGRGVESTLAGQALPAIGAPGATAAPLVPLVAPADADLERMQAILAEQPALASSLKASIGPDGRVRLQGFVSDDEALETLLRPVIRDGLRVTLQVLTESELQSRLKALNQTLLPLGARARSMADGRIMVLGEVADEPAISTVVATAGQEIPEALGVEAAVLTRLESQSRQQAITAAETAKRPVLPPMAPLPEVISVIGGEESFIVLADGLRVGPGGQAGTWRVASIRAGGVTFVDSAGRSRSIQP